MLPRRRRRGRRRRHAPVGFKVPEREALVGAIPVGGVPPSRSNHRAPPVGPAQSGSNRRPPRGDEVAVVEVGRDPWPSRSCRDWIRVSSRGRRPAACPALHDPEVPLDPLQASNGRPGLAGEDQRASTISLGGEGRDVHQDRGPYLPATGVRHRRLGGTAPSGPSGRSRIGAPRRPRPGGDPDGDAVRRAATEVDLPELQHISPESRIAVPLPGPEGAAEHVDRLGLGRSGFGPVPIVNQSSSSANPPEQLVPEVRATDRIRHLRGGRDVPGLPAQ